MPIPTDTVAEASDAPTSTGDRFEDFADFLETNGDVPAVEEEEDDDSGDEPDTDEGDEPEAEEAESEEEEPAGPAIDPPVSWPAEEKERFSQLPPETQEYLATRESEREKFVQSKATEAAEARKAAAQATETQTTLHNNYAAQLEAVANAVLVAEPDAYLARTDPQAYIAQLAEHNQSVAQWHQLTAQAEQARQQVAAQEQQRTAQFYQAEAERLTSLIPETVDPAVRTRIIEEATKFGESVGYAPDTLAKMDATDVAALHQAAQWKAKADKYDALQKSNMEKVRSAKKMPKVVRPGVAPTQGEVNSSKSQQAWSKVVGAKSKDQQASAFADYLGL